jgi:hypothetical protein
MGCDEPSALQAWSVLPLLCGSRWFNSKQVLVARMMGTTFKDCTLYFGGDCHYDFLFVTVASNNNKMVMDNSSINVHMVLMLSRNFPSGSHSSSLLFCHGGPPCPGHYCLRKGVTYVLIGETWLAVMPDEIWRAFRGRHTYRH